MVTKPNVVSNLQDSSYSSSFSNSREKQASSGRPVPVPGARRDFGQWQGSYPDDNELARKFLALQGRQTEGFTDSAFSNSLGVMTPLRCFLPLSFSFSVSLSFFRLSFVRLPTCNGRIAQRSNFGTRLVCRAETAPDLAGHEPVGSRRGGEIRGMGSAREREKRTGSYRGGGRGEKGGDRNNVFIKKGPSKSSLIVLFAGYARARRDISVPGAR